MQGRHLPKELPGICIGATSFLYVRPGFLCTQASGHPASDFDPCEDAYLKNPTFTPEYMVAIMRLQIIRKRADNHPSHLLCGLVLHQCAWRGINA
jgi:hypothetical protein